MNCTVYPLNALNPYKYVVVLSFHNGKIVLSRHRQRDTWETQGGHIEKGETPLDAAKRELWEESGAKEFELIPLFDYRAGSEKDFADGQVFAALIQSFEPLPDSEMAEIRFFDALPERLTYPTITPILFAEAKKRGWPFPGLSAQKP